MRTRRTPCVERPAWRISPASNRMIFPSLEHIVDFARSRRRLHIDDALAAARRQAIILQRRSLSVAILRDRQDESILVDHLHYIDKGSKKKTASKKSSQSELDRSIDTRTVPSRYKSQIPREYHGYIPWGR